MPRSTDDKSSDTKARLAYENGLFNAAIGDQAHMENAYDAFLICRLRKYEQRYLDACKELGALSPRELAAFLTPSRVDQEIRRLMQASDTRSLAPISVPRQSSSGSIGGLSANDECFSEELNRVCAANLGPECKAVGDDILRYESSFSIGGASLGGRTMSETNSYDATRAAACMQSAGVYGNLVCSREYERRGFPQCARCTRLQAEEMQRTATQAFDNLRQLSDVPNPSIESLRAQCGFPR